MTDLKVVLPQPCSEPWEGMAPQGCNRHCASCDKTIHDLSMLTVDEAEDLLKSADAVCVRAQIGPGGVVALAPAPVQGRTGRHRRMIAAVGASATLAAAACQTIPSVERPNRYEISGTLPWHQRPVLRSSDGRTWQVDVEWRSTSFRFPDLYPGIYSLTYDGDCMMERRVIENIVISDASLDLGQLEGEPCIIIGQMTLPEPGQNG